MAELSAKVTLSDSSDIEEWNQWQQSQLKHIQEGNIDECI